MLLQLLNLSRRNFWLVFVLLILSSNIGISQNAYRAVILDESTNQSIANVNILIVNSTEGYFSDRHGKFSIPNEKAAGADLIFSHVNYEASSKFIPINYSGRDTIFLSPVSHRIDNVMITSKKNDLKKRRLLLFRKDLFDFIFGKKNMYKEVDFMNPDDLLFQLSDTVLTAKSTKLLDFKNNYLGYDIRCFMQEYTRDNHNLTFTGKASFKDIAVSKRKKKKYLKRREELWKVSQQNFLRSILSNDVNQKTYLCSALDPTNIINGYQTITDFEDFVYPTKIPNVYAIITPAPITIKSEKQISHLIPKKGIILVNRKGIILNKEEVQLRGYWEEMSLTKFLPTDYKKQDDKRIPVDSKSIRSIGELRLWARELQNFTERNRHLDEIVLETDRFFYNSFERVQVSARVFHHWSRSPIHNILVKFELVDKDGEILSTKIKKAENGICNTSFELVDSLPADEYGIRAYTDFMQYFSEDLYGSTTFAINMLEDHGIASEADSVHISIVPEGGNLLYEVENRVVAHIKNAKGVPVDFEGWILDKTTDEKVVLKTTLPGLAIVNLYPSKSSDYQIVSNSNEHIFSNIDDLTPVNGTNLHVQSRNQDKFVISIVSNEKIPSGTIRILNRGRLVHEIEASSSQSTFSISKDFLPNDILNLQLVDEKGHTLSERLIDNSVKTKSFLEFDKQYQFFYTNQACEIDLVPDSLSNNFADSLGWNVRIVHKEYAQNAITQEHLSFPSFSEETFKDLSPTNKAYLRNIGLVGNSIHTEYLSAYEKDISKYDFTKDFPLSISGKLSDPDPPYGSADGRINITSMSSVPYLDEITTDENGSFEFENLPYESNLGFIIQARKNVDEGDDILEGDRYVVVKLDADTLPLPKSKTTFHFRKDLIPNDSLIAFQQERSARLSQSVELDEVVIKDRVHGSVSSGAVKDLERMDWIPKYAMGQQLVKLLYPSKIIRRSIKDPGQMEIQVNTRKDGFVYQTLLIVVNGNLEFGSGTFEALMADRIKYLSIAENVLSIVTTPGMKSRTDSRAEGLGIAIYTIPTTIDDTDLSQINDPAPRRFSASDYRKTLYWNPQELITKEENRILFRSSMLTGEYEIIASTVHPLLGYVSFSSTFEVVEETE